MNETAGHIRAETEDEAGMVATPSGNVYFLNAAGSLAEMGRQVGRKVSEIIHDGPIPFYTTFLSRSLQESPVANASNIVSWATQKWAADRIIEGIDGEFREAVEQFARAAGIGTRSYLKACALPETFLWLLGTMHRLTGSPRAAGLGQPPIGGCTSAVVRPPDAPTTLHARNFDYFGIDFWERTATVHFYHPDDGLDYASATSAGILGGGITAMNAAGLTLAVHQHFVDRFDLDAVPVGLAGDRVMRRARNIDEALEVLRDNPPIAGWSYVLTEGDTGRVAVYEAIPGVENVYRLPKDESRLAYSNVFWGEDLEVAEVDYYPEYRRDNYARQTRALAMTASLLEGDEEVAVQQMASVLGDFYDTTDEKMRLAGRTIAAAHTVGSVVFEPEQRRLWIGSGPSPAARSWMVPFRLSSPERPGIGDPDPEVESFHPAPGWDRTAHGQAFRLYREACVRKAEGETDKRLLIQIEHALALYPEEPSLHILAGLLALRSGRARRAEGAFRSALERLNDLSRRAEVTLYLAWSLDLQDQRSSARQLYREVIRSQSADPAVDRRARTGRWWAFSESKAGRLAIDFIHVGVV